MSIAQIAAAVGTIILAVLTYVYVVFTRNMVREMRETRIAQERPQVIVDADYSDPSVIDVVVRNIGKGATKEISFGFSAPMESSMSVRESSEAVPLNELPYFKEGIDFLAPDAEIRCTWDTYVGLLPLLEERGPKEGLTITSRYKSLAGDSHEIKWKINPLLLTGAPNVVRKGMHDLTEAAESISKNFDRVTSLSELQVITKTERQRESEQLRAELQNSHGEASE